MRTIRTRSWHTFELAIKELRRQYPGTNGSPVRKPSRRAGARLLFRGQGNERWPLSTTLERKSKKKFDVLSYLTLALRGREEIESFTGRRWDAPRYPDLQTQVLTKQSRARIHLPAYDYLVYLRQHGYPSPLLDWTESAYIAAYFAYAGAGSVNPCVYCFVEHPNGMKESPSGEPTVSVMGPFVSTNKRYFSQKTWYTIATQWDDKTLSHVFCEHEKVFSGYSENQDALIKIVLPASAKTNALQALSAYHIDHFTLFRSEDGLIRALETQHFDLPGR